MRTKAVKQERGIHAHILGNSEAVARIGVNGCGYEITSDGQSIGIIVEIKRNWWIAQGVTFLDGTTYKRYKNMSAARDGLVGRVARETQP